MCASKNIKYYTNKNYNNFETSCNNLLSKQSISHAQEHCLCVPLERNPLEHKIYSATFIVKYYSD